MNTDCVNCKHTRLWTDKEQIEYIEKTYNKGYYEALQKLAEECEDVLDKIRAAIDSYCSENRDRNDGLYIAMRIIDKYKAESEPQESEG